MRRIMEYAAAILLVVTVAACMIIPVEPPELSVVKIELQGGHGSGVHIGNGYIAWKRGRA